MDEKTNLNTMLTLTKNMCEILFHGNIEAQDKSVLKEFNNALNDYLTLQMDIYNLMKDKGYYTVSEAPKDKIETVKSKFEEKLI